MGYKLVPAENPKNIFERIKNKFVRELFTNPKRSALRKRFLREFPVYRQEGGQEFSVHMLMGKRDIEMAVCSCKALNYLSGLNIEYTLHDDGTLTDEDRLFIQQHLNARVMMRKDADALASEMLASFPHILKYRKSQLMSLKLIDVKLFSKGNRIAYIDSDILFFKRPDFFLETLQKQVLQTNYFNKDLLNAYVATPDEIFTKTAHRPFEKTNAGLWVLNAEDIDFNKIENFLKGDFFGRFTDKYLLEQTFVSILARESNSGIDYLPTPYDVDLLKKPANSTSKHYVGKIRHGYELEGLRFLLKKFHGKKNAIPA